MMRLLIGYICFTIVSVKLVGKLQDGTVFTKKGHNDEQPFEFKIDEGMLDTCLKWFFFY